MEELPLYEASGQGDHVFVRFTKRMRTTEEAVRAIAGALGASSRDCGVAGYKDKVGVTTQTISVQPPRGVRAADLALRLWPPELVPAGAVRDLAAADGRVLVGAARAGEPLTDVRLVGAGLAAGGSAAAVPVRLGDAAVAALLVPGIKRSRSTATAQLAENTA